MQNKKNILTVILLIILIPFLYYYLINTINVADKTASDTKTSVLPTQQPAETITPLAFGVLIDNKKVKTFNAENIDSITKPIPTGTAVFKNQKMVFLNEILSNLGINLGKEIILLSHDGQDIKITWDEAINEKEPFMLVTTNSRQWKVVKGDIKTGVAGSFLLRGVKSINVFTTANNTIKSEISDELKKCGNSNIYTSIDDALKEADKVCILVISRQNLTTVPNEITSLPKLTILKLGRNKIATVPSSIKSLINLITIEIENNELTSLPKELGQLTNLEHLDFDNNQLSTVPIELVSLKKLKSLGLSGNNFSNMEKAKIEKMLNWVDIEW